MQQVIPVTEVSTSAQTPFLFRNIAPIFMFSICILMRERGALTALCHRRCECLAPIALTPSLGARGNGASTGRGGGNILQSMEDVVAGFHDHAVC